MANEYYQSVYTGTQIDASIGKIINGEIDRLAEAAKTSASIAESARDDVRNSLDNIPPGQVIIINDLTTGGTKAALSAEMGKTLNSGKVNKSGDTMMGTLNFNPGNHGTRRGQISKSVNSSTGEDYGTHINDRDVNGDSILLMVQALSKQVAIQTITNGAYSQKYTFLHTGNKPSGYYTGNGDATSRTLEIGALGRVVAVWSNNGSALIVNAVGFGRANDGLKEISGGNVFVGSTGNLVLSTTNALLNASGVTYNYQVL